jgi:hypothetical protein
LGLVALLLGLVRGEAPAALELFNGKDLTGWVVEGAKDYKEGGKALPIWVAEGGMIRCRVPGRSYGFLRYAKREFGDFALHLEYRFAKPAGPRLRLSNSGVGIRTVPYDPKRSGKTRPSAAGYEVQLLDDAGQPPSKHSTGSLYLHVAPKVNAAKAAPAWNVLDVECVGPRIKVTLNGQEVIDVDQTTVPTAKNKPLKGYVCLQNHGSPIDFRNLRVREIKPKN